MLDVKQRDAALISEAKSPLLTGLRLERARASGRFGDDGRFHNPSGLGPSLQGPPWPVMKDFFFGGGQRRPTRALPVESPLPVLAKRASTELRMTWLGHSTVLIEIDGVRVLTDPVFGERVAPVTFAGPKRFHQTPAALSQLPPLDAVLLSHDHYDHLCASSMRQIAKLGVPVITSLGVGARLEAMGVHPKRIVELDWWEDFTLPGGALRFTATPAQHFSGRSLTDRNRTLWSSWVMTSASHRVFFSGDTGLTEDFREIGRLYGPFDVVMLEIGAWHPAWGAIHLGPENALRAFEMLRGKALFPVHWSTFDLALHAWDEPAETLVHLAHQGGQRIITPRLGRPFELAHVEGVDPWWREAR